VAVTLTVIEAAATYEKAMRNVLPAGPGVCCTCHTFIDEDYALCYPCNDQPEYLDAVVPITYSEHLGQMHTALRNYKDGYVQSQQYMTPRLAAILWLFIERHERCVARAAGAVGEEFDVVTTVPSSTRERDDKRENLRWIVGTACVPTASRFKRVLTPTDAVPAGRAYDPERYVANERLDGLDVLLIDDTWTAGGHAQSAGAAVKAAGARSVGSVVIGRHIRRSWEVVPGGATSGELFDALPRDFDWDTCCVHVPESDEQ
jgi:predicted amidophosphoribosyltransferase